VGISSCELGRGFGPGLFREIARVRRWRAGMPHFDRQSIQNISHSRFERLEAIGGGTMNAVTLGHAFTPSSSTHPSWSVSMGQGSKKVGTFVHNPRASVSENLIAFFRAVHGAKYIECAASALRVSQASIRKMEQRNGCPSFMMVKRIGDVYGAEGAHALTGWGWLDAPVREAKAATLQIKIEQMQAEKARIESR
jgi:hypothetical protein